MLEFKKDTIDLETASDFELRVELMEVTEELDTLRQQIVDHRGCKKCREYRRMLTDRDQLTVYKTRLEKLLGDLS